MISEATLATSVAEWLRANAWDTYFEVELSSKARRAEYKMRRGLDCVGLGRADIVATNGRLVAVAECKVVLGLDVFYQARRWAFYADRIWICVPAAKQTKARLAAFEMAREAGFGVLEFADPGVVTETLAPRQTHERSDDGLLNSLCEEHKTCAAPGTNRGGQHTSFKRTAGLVAEYVAKHPEGAKVDEIVAVVDHHYRRKSDALKGIASAAKAKLIPGVRVGWRQMLYPVDVAPAADGVSE